MNFKTLSPEYATLWDGMDITDRLRSAVDAMAAKILLGKDRYQAIEAQARVPWFVVGVIHAMEAGCRFSCHLHNGDPLSSKTRLVPAGRPSKGVAPFTWEQSACDALLMKGYEKFDAWTIERICWALENYNGWGYRKYHKETPSPYLWSGSNHYRAGKYVADGKWSATAVSAQPGAMPLIKRLSELDDSIVLTSAFAADSTTPDEITPASYRSTDAPPMSPAAQATIATGAAGSAAVIPTVPSMVSDSTANAEAWQGLATSAAGMLKWAVSSPLALAIIAVTALGLWAANKWGKA